jgi:hypothetical protein
MKTRPFIAADQMGRVCGCEECVAHGVATESMRRVPAASGGARWIHGRELAGWLKAKHDFDTKARTLLGPRGRRERMERLLEPVGDAQ